MAKREKLQRIVPSEEVRTWLCFLFNMWAPHLRGCKTRVSVGHDKATGQEKFELRPVITGYWVSAGSKITLADVTLAGPPQIFPKKATEIQRLAAEKAYTGLQGLRTVLECLEEGDLNNAILFAGVTGMLCGRTAEFEHYSKKMLANIEALATPRRAQGKATRDRVLAAYHPVPGEKKTTYVKRLAKQLKVGQSTVWKHLSSG